MYGEKFGLGVLEPGLFIVRVECCVECEQEAERGEGSERCNLDARCALGDRIEVSFKHLWSLGVDLGLDPVAGHVEAGVGGECCDV